MPTSKGEGKGKREGRGWKGEKGGREGEGREGREKENGRNGMALNQIKSNRKSIHGVSNHIFTSQIKFKMVQIAFNPNCD